MPNQNLETVLDRDSYDWLVNNWPDLADVVEAEIAKGTTPAELRRRVIRHTWRYDLARRVEQAARHL